ncbi:MAG TPA: hypothetical protein VMB84_14695 [Stellaceae bacterium]|nr:hypothetical protein [Stellaceae bacterium]
MTAEYGWEVAAVRKALAAGRPDRAAAQLDELIAAGRHMGDAVPMLANLLRENARETRLLDRMLSLLEFHAFESATYDDIDTPFRRRIRDSRVHDEVVALAWRRPEAREAFLLLVDDFINEDRADRAAALLKQVAPIEYTTLRDYVRAGKALADRGFAGYIAIWHYLCGRIALAAGDLPRALESFTAAAALDTRLQPARAYAGKVARRLGQGAKACAFFDLEPDIPYAIYTGW